MKSCLKTLVITVGLVLIGIAIVGIAVSTQLEKSARTIVEQGVAYVYQSEVTVGGVDVRIVEGTIEIQDITVFSPESFRREAAMAADRISVTFDIGSLVTKRPTVERIHVTNPRISLRYRPGTGTNIGVLMDSASRFAADDDPEGAPVGTRRRFLIRELTSEGGSINLSSNLLPLSRVGIEVAPFTIEELSTENPVNIGEIGVVIVRSVFTKGVNLKGILGPVSERLIDEMQGLWAGVRSEPPSAPATP